MGPTPTTVPGSTSAYIFFPFQHSAPDPCLGRNVAIFGPPPSFRPRPLPERGYRDPHEAGAEVGRKETPTRLTSLMQNKVFLWALLALVLPATAASQETYSLEELLRLGREQNPTLQALRANETALEADRRASGRWENPELGFETGTGDPSEGGASRSLEGFTLSQTLENPFRRHYRLSAMGSLSDAAGEEFRSGLLDLEYEIRLHYYRILYLSELSRLARINEEALDEIRGLIETRAALGEVKELEAIRLRVEALRARNETEAAEMELEQYRKHLNTFLGNALPADFQLTGSLAADEPEPDLDSLVQHVLPQHPDLARAGMEREAAVATMKATGVAWIPDPVLTGSSRKELDGDIRTLGIGIRIPLWSFPRPALERDRQRVRQMEEKESALLLELQAQLMIHHNHLRLARQTLNLFQDGLLEESEASMEIAEASYREGEISFVEYLDARRTYHSIQIEYHQALYDWSVERAALDRAAGGGTL